MNKLSDEKRMYGLLALVCVVFLAVFLFSRTDAKYTSKNQSGDSGRVADFIFDIDEQYFEEGFKLELDPTVTVNTKTIQIKGESEDKVEIRISLKLMGNLPLKAKIKPVTVKDKEYKAPEVANTLSQDESTRKLRDSDGVMTIAMDPIIYSPNEEINQEISFDVVWTDDEDYKSSIYENGVEYAEFVIEVKQID